MTDHTCTRCSATSATYFMHRVSLRCSQRKSRLKQAYAEESKGLPVFHCNFASITHRFVYIEVLPLTRNDVILKSPPGGAAGEL
jgi:hypothetical protein